MFDSFPTDRNHNFNSSVTNSGLNLEPTDSIFSQQSSISPPPTISAFSQEVIDFNPSVVSEKGSLTPLHLCSKTESAEDLKAGESSVDALTGESLSNRNDGNLRISPIVEQAVRSAQGYLSGLASDPDFNGKMDLAFGDSWNADVANNLVKAFAKGDFSQIPGIEIVPSSAINGANGAFASVTNTIYLAKEFVEQNAGNLGAITSVVLEETGHFIDSKVNVSDAAGDEGDIFARVVEGKAISADELGNLKGEDDHANISLGGKDISIEMSQIAMASLNSKIYQSHRGFYNDNIYTRSSTDGVTWTPWNTNYDGNTPSAPALAALNSKIYQSIRGFNNQIYTRSSTDGVKWSNWYESSGWQTTSAPTLESFNGKLYQSIRGLDNKIYTRSSTDGINWIGGWNSNYDGDTPTALSLVALNGKLYQSHQGLNNNIYTRSSTDGVNWTGWNNNGGGETPTELNDLTSTQIRVNNTPYSVNLKLFSANGKTEQGGIDTKKDTIVVIHGRNNNGEIDTNLESLAKTAAASQYYSNSQVLSLDWHEAAKDDAKIPYNAASRIRPVAQWAADRLKELGIDPKRTILVGHSLGSYVASEIGRILGKVKELVALDPAYPGSPTSGISAYDIDGTNNNPFDRPIAFRNAATNSIAFVASDSGGGLAGDNDFAGTANSSFIVSFSNYKNPTKDPFQRDTDYHNAVVKVFADQISRNLNFPSFNPNGWYSNFGEKRDWFTSSLYFSHEGVINADLSDRDNPKISRLRYVYDGWGNERTTWA